MSLTLPAVQPHHTPPTNTHRYLSTTLKYDRARRARADEAGNALTNALTNFM